MSLVVQKHFNLQCSLPSEPHMRMRGGLGRCSEVRRATIGGYGINLSARVASNVNMTSLDSSFLHLLVILARGYLGRGSPCLLNLVGRVHGERQNAG